MTQPDVLSAARSEPHDVGAALAPGAADSGQAELVSFAIGDEQYGVDIMAVCEIKEWSNVRHLPRQPEYVRGVLNFRGVVVPVIDLRCRFGQGLTESTPTHIVMIVTVDERQVGLLADRVLDIVSFGADDIRPVPSVAQSRRAHFLSGLVADDDAMLALIDLPSLLSGHDGEGAWQFDQ